MGMKKLITVGLLIGTVFLVSALAKELNLLVNLTDEVSSVITSDQGQKIKIIRIQDSAHKLTDDFSKTSRECPPYCIQPTQINENISNIGELELFQFIGNEVNAHDGILVDTRLKSWFELESIPSAINISFSSIEKSSEKGIQKLFSILGAKDFTNGNWDFSNVKKLVIFDNGPWCAQAQYFVNALLKYNYPTSKILYYRSGLQGWKLMGLTTVVHKAEIVH